MRYKGSFFSETNDNKVINDIENKKDNNDMNPFLFTKFDFILIGIVLVSKFIFDISIFFFDTFNDMGMTIVLFIFLLTIIYIKNIYVIIYFSYFMINYFIGIHKVILIFLTSLMLFYLAYGSIYFDINLFIYLIIVDIIYILLVFSLIYKKIK